MAGKIIADQIEHSTAGSLDTSYVVNGSAKAWGHFEGSDAILDDSLNTSSLIDNPTTDFTVNFSNAMDNEHYAVACAGLDAAIISNRANGYTTSSYTFVVRNSTFTAVVKDDTTYVVHGDLA